MFALKSIVVICVLLSAVSCKDDQTMDKFIREALETLRSYMKKGMPDMNVPVLDPFRAPNIVQNFSSMGLVANLNISDGNVTGLSTFVVKSVNFDLNTVTLKISIEVPLLSLNGSYDLKGKFLHFIPLNVNDKVFIDAEKVEMNITSSVDSVNNKPQLKTMDVKLNFTDLKVRFEKLPNLVNKALTSLIKQAFKLFRGKIEEEIDDDIKIFINKLLQGLDFGGLYPSP